MNMLDACASSDEYPVTSMHSMIDDELLKEDLFLNGVLQPEESCLSFHDEDYIRKIREFQFYLDTVKEIVKPGCSPEVLNVALTSMSTLVKVLVVMSSRPYPLASL